MKRVWVAILVVCCLMCSGCAVLPPELTEKNAVDFTVGDYGLTITADGSFEEVTDGAWDLQLTDGDVYISVMAYYTIDLSADLTPKDIYNLQHDDLFGKREQVQILEESTERTFAKKTICKTRFSAENDGQKNYYDSYLIDFKNDGVFAWVLVNSVPSTMEARAADTDAIVRSLHVA